MKMIRRLLGCVAILIFLPLNCGLAATWYVKADSKAPNPDGSKSAPFSTIQQVINQAKEKDTIHILASNEVLTGQFKLKPGQTLMSDGKVNCAANADNACTYNDKGAVVSNPNGDSIVLADNTKVIGVTILNSGGYGIVGHNVNHVSIEDTQILNANQLGQFQQQVLPPDEFRGFMMMHTKTDKEKTKYFLKGGIGLLGTKSGKMGKIHINRVLIAANNNEGNKGPGVALMLDDNSQSQLNIEKVNIQQSGMVKSVLPNFISGMYFLVTGSARAQVSMDHVKISQLKFHNDGIDLITFQDGQLWTRIKNYTYLAGPEQGGMSQALETISAYGPSKFAKLLGKKGREHHSKLVLRVEDSRLTAGEGRAFLMCNPLGLAKDNIIDLGGGPSLNNGTSFDAPSTGHNQIYKLYEPKGKMGQVTMMVINGVVYAKHNWWGNDATQLNDNNVMVLKPELTKICGKNFKMKLCMKPVSELITAPASSKKS